VSVSQRSDLSVNFLRVRPFGDRCTRLVRLPAEHLCPAGPVAVGLGDVTVAVVVGTELDPHHVPGRRLPSPGGGLVGRDDPDAVGLRIAVDARFLLARPDPLAPGNFCAGLHGVVVIGVQDHSR